VDSTYSAVTWLSYGSGSSRARGAATVQLFSFSKYDPMANRMVIRSSTTPWSTPFSIDTVGAVGEVSVHTLDGPAQLGMEVTLGMALARRQQQTFASVPQLMLPRRRPLSHLATGHAAYLRTKVVAFAPRFIVINRTPWAIEVEQCDSEGAPN